MSGHEQHQKSALGLQKDRESLVKLTNASVRVLALPPGVSEKTYFDGWLASFGVRVRASGHRSFVVQYKIGRKHRRKCLAKWASSISVR